MHSLCSSFDHNKTKSTTQTMNIILWPYCVVVVFVFIVVVVVFVVAVVVVMIKMLTEVIFGLIVSTDFMFFAGVFMLFNVVVVVTKVVVVADSC